MPDPVSVGNALASGLIWVVAVVATLRLCVLISAPREGNRRG